MLLVARRDRVCYDFGMNTDKHVYEVFAAFPEWVFLLIKRKQNGTYRFVSVTIKAIQRSADGVLFPDLFDEPILVLEYQMYPDEKIYGRIVIEMAIIQQENPGREVQGLVIFGSRDLDPRTDPWSKVVSAYYLDEMLSELAETSPDHPLVALFQPLVEKNTDLLRQNAKNYYTQIEAYATENSSKNKLKDVFLDWLIQRFKDLGKKEIEQMLLGKLPDLRETQAGKDLIAIGLEQGIEQGIGQGIEQGIEQGELIGTIRTCQSLLSEPPYAEATLKSKSIDELTKIASELQTRLRSRMN